MTVIKWEKQALSDREVIFRYLYREAGLSVAEATDKRFINQINLLEANPLAGVKAGRLKNRRRLTMTRLPFIIVYAVEAEIIYILRVLHTSRKISTGYR